MNEIKNDSDSNDGKRTLLGVGLASLLGNSQSVVNEGGARLSREPSIEISGEFTSSGPVDRDDARDEVSTDRGASTGPRSLTYPPFRASRPWSTATLATLGALGLSVAVGLGARSLFSTSQPESGRASPAVVSADVIPVKPIVPLSVAPMAPTTPVPAARVDETPAAATPAAAPPVAAPPALPPASRQPPIEPPALRAVHLGNGSCSLVVDSTVTGEVSVDDQPVGPTPTVVSGLWCGRQMTVQITRAGYDGWSKAIRTQEGRTSRIMARPRRTPATTPSDIIEPTARASYLIGAPAFDSSRVPEPQDRSMRAGDR